VSSDRGEESFNEYFNEMPWLAVPFGHSMKSTLSKHFGVQGEYFLYFIPCHRKVSTKNTGKLLYVCSGVSSRAS